MKKVAIIHDWLIVPGGSEKVLAQLLELFPQADLFTLLDYFPRQQRQFLAGHSITTSILQSFPLARRYYRYYIPLMPLAVEQFDVSSYELVISCSHAVAKGVLTSPDQLHLSYVHTPMRYAWDMQHEYIREMGLEKSPLGWILRWILHHLREWDLRAANGVDYFAANSNFIARRILKTYRRPARVIYPPVDIQAFSLQEKKENFYLAVSRIVPYKKINLIVEAFSQMPEKKLVVIGEGPMQKKIQAKGKANIQFLPAQPADVLHDYLRRARAFVIAAQEDFGITPVEAQACGTPVIAFGRGGACETIRPLSEPDPTGIFFFEQSASALQQAVFIFEREMQKIAPESCRRNAERFSRERFQQEFCAFVDDALGGHLSL